MISDVDVTSEDEEEAEDEWLEVGVAVEDVDGVQFWDSNLTW